ncbi:ribose transport system permease protein [Bradyrhizobium sp. CIR48]|uniref:ABC transporter permease n=1 Tax=Bradyrhizobium sp. CIR48 TaxID=2663840 RepID=UPI0016066A7B|nr:ABC transporter permease [Bradyrhizobium sp. CIR48]MBB4425427.1 ribose transport system permease protein [Bradyrhizobium sp. CIR48]
MQNNLVASHRLAFHLPQLSQERVVLLVTIVTIIVFSVLLDGFATLGNLLTMARNVSILGIMALGMAIVVIGRGLDLSIVATMVASSAALLSMLNAGHGLPLSLAAGLLTALAVGAVNGFVIAFLEVPALFATLATTFLISGLTRNLMDQIIIYPPKAAQLFLAIGQGRLLGVPSPILFFGATAIVVNLLLSKTVVGRFIYAYGDNALTARLSGIGVRPLVIGQYMLSAAIAFVAGVVLTSSTGSLNLRFVESTVIFDVILVVVLGGVSLVGGRGGVPSVFVGAALIGTLLNGLTLLNFSNLGQDIIKGLVLLGAIITDNRLHPRDEETAKQGD